MKSREKLSKLDDKSTDIFEEGLIEHYCDRPHYLKSFRLKNLQLTIDTRVLQVPKRTYLEIILDPFSQECQAE